MEESTMQDLVRLGEHFLERSKETYAKNQKALDILNELTVDDLEFSDVVVTELEKGSRSIAASIVSKNGRLKARNQSLIIVAKKPAPKKRKAK